MGKIIKYNQNELPTLQYQEEPNLKIYGNVIQNSIYDKTSKEGQVFTIIFPNQLLPTEVYSYAINPDDEETFENTVSFQTLVDLLNYTGEQTEFYFGDLYKTGSVSITGASITALMFARNNDSINLEDVPSISGDQSSSLDLFSFMAALNRFNSRRVDISFQYNSIIYNIQDCDTLSDRVKLVKYNNTSKYSNIIDQLQCIYNEEGLQITDFGTGYIRFCYKGVLGGYQKIIQNNDYIINVDGYTNDKESYNNAKSVNIFQNYKTEIIYRNHHLSKSLEYTKDPEEDGKHQYNIYGLNIQPAAVGITVNDILNNASIKIHINNYLNGESSETSQVNFSDFEIVEDPETHVRLYNITEFFNSVFTEYNWNIVICIYSETLVSTGNIVFLFDKIGKVIESFVDLHSQDPNIENIVHEGTYNYTIPENSSTILYINNFNYTNPEIKMDQGCLIKGTKISMADGTLKNIEDVQIGDYVIDNEGISQRVIWNQPQGHSIADYYTSYTLPDGRKLGVIADERILWNGKYQFISTIPEIKSRRVNGNYQPYEIWTTGKDVIIANGIPCGKIYSNIKCNLLRNMLKFLYRILFLHKKDYKCINYIHDFIGQKILKHKIK